MSDAIRRLTQALHLTPGSPLGTSPLASTAAGALLGAGLGYGAGRLAENVLPDALVTPGVLRRRLMTAGGVLGALPGAYLGTVNARLALDGDRGVLGALASQAEPNAFLGGKEGEYRTALAKLGPPDGALEKLADGMAGGLLSQQIPVDQFNRAVWADPYTPVPDKATVAAVLQGAAVQAGSPWVSPMDVARVAVGMGSGLLAGVMAGKVLGRLAGLPPHSQRALQQAGVWAGAVKGVAPLILGR